MKAHEYPRPMWHRDKPGVIAYAANLQEMTKMKTIDGQGNPYGGGWQEDKITTTFPLALHSGNNQGITVYDEQQLQTALKNGWSLKPVIDETPRSLPASPDRPPLPIDESDAVPTAPMATQQRGESPRRRASA